jgi:aminoglycoside phosphotransferase (APT) family kinase protein
VLLEQRASLIAVQFALGGDAVLSGPVARGEVGEVWKLTTNAGSWAVKMPFVAPPFAEAEDDGRYQDAVRSTGVPMPALLRTRDGASIADVGGVALRVYEWVELQARDPRLDPVTVGTVVAAIHRVRHIGANPVDAWYVDPVGAPAWDQLVADVIAARAPFAAQLAELRDDLVELETLLAEPRDLQTCHRDLFADNVLSTADGSVCVIDWENSGLADPSQELGLVLFEFGCGDVGRARTLYDAYRDAGGTGRIRRRNDFSMVIAQLGHIGQHACRCWLDPARAHERHRNLARVDEFVSSTISPAQVDALLDAVT